MKASIIIEYNGIKEVYFSSEDIQLVKEKFSYIREEPKKLKVHFVRDCSTIIDTYDNNTFESRLYYISLSNGKN